MKKTSIGIIVSLIVVIFLITLAFKKKSVTLTKNQQRYEIVQRWELPTILDEVSDITWLNDNHIAAVQDENGVVYIFNLTTSRIENRIEFAGGGDYEGLTRSGDTVYIMRSDGVVFEVTDFNKENLQVQEYSSGLSAIEGIDMEGLTLDQQNKRLLLAVKEQEEKRNFKEVFEMNLNTKETNQNPVYKVQLSDPIFDGIDGDRDERFTPSELDIHPVTGNYYFLDGTNPKLLIASQDGELKELVLLDRENFEQPEGITFAPDGTLYISNEAGQQSANILQVKLNK